MRLMKLHAKSMRNVRVPTDVTQCIRKKFGKVLESYELERKVEKCYQKGKKLNEPKLKEKCVFCKFPSVMSWMIRFLRSKSLRRIE